MEGREGRYDGQTDEREGGASLYIVGRLCWRSDAQWFTVQSSGSFSSSINMQKHRVTVQYGTLWPPVAAQNQRTKSTTTESSDAFLFDTTDTLQLLHECQSTTTTRDD